MEEVENIATFNEEGKVVLKNKERVRKGKLSRAQGTRFEAKVRKEFEERGWVIDKWTNNVDFENDKIVPARRKFNPFMKALTMGTGFPDFVALKKVGDKYEVIGVEVKMKGLLDKKEKEKCKWYLDNGIFSKILVAKKGEKKGGIEHVDFKEGWGGKYKS
jgi:hypothetical protein